jgi:hypothetical protein
MTTQAAWADLLLKRSQLKGKRRTRKRSRVMRKMIKADTSFDSRERNPAT